MAKIFHSALLKIAVIAMAVAVIGVLVKLTRNSYGNPIRAFSSFLDSLFASVFSSWRTSSYQFELGIILFLIVIVVIYLVFRGIFLTYRK